MAKKTKTEVVEVAPVSEVSIPTIPESHKDPAQRTHLWERPARADEKPAEAKPHADYKYELPRWLHKDGEQKYVTTPEACDAALDAGWEIHPSGVK